MFGVLQFLLLNGFLVVLAAGEFTPRVVNKEEEDDQEERSVPFNLEETYGQNFRSYGFNGTWRTDTDILYTDKDTGDIVAYDVTTHTRRILVNAVVTILYNEPLISFSYDDSLLLLSHNFATGYRYSMYQQFVVYDTKKKTYTKIANGTLLPLAKWAPNKNALVYVLDNDIYYQEFSDGPQKVRRLTYTGLPGVVYNGIPDWVYEEEVLASSAALWFSPDGSHLAFATYNDTNVKDAMILYYGKPGILKDQYPKEVKIKYPKAGSPNPIVSLSVVDLTNPSSELVNLWAPIENVGVDKILYTVNWWDAKVVATWTNRVQNRAQLVLYDTLGNSEKIFFEYQDKGWLRIHSPIYYENFAIILRPQNAGDAGEFLHVTRFEYVNGSLTDETDLTPGASEVHAISGIDSIRKRVYYLATGVGQPSQRNLYYVPLDGTEDPVCVSCTILTPEGNPCTYAYAYFSLERSHYVLSCSGPDPTSISIHDYTHEKLMMWEENKYLRQSVASRLQPLVKNLSVRVEGYDCNVRLFLPPDFDESRKYPLLINVYAGPNTVRVNDAASYGFHSYVTTNRSVIYGYIDGRGSAYKGSKMLYEIYRRLGTVEIEDQIAVTSILQKSFSWIDANKTGIWGWSYGGFSTAMVLATDKNSVFKCGISVAAVSSWIYYDSIYTERYMGLPTPEDNLLGYNRTDVTRLVEGIRGKKYLLIHGTGDDNVHYQQAMALNKALADSDIMFEEQSYTDETHGLTGVSPHLYHKMDKFWSECLYNV